MSKTTRSFGLTTVAALAITIGATVQIAPSAAVPAPSQAAIVADGNSHAEPRRFEVAQAQSGGKPSSLPGGASSLNETYEDWRVACVHQAAEKRCVLSQVQTHKNGQRVLAIELGSAAGNAISGALVLPFGLALDAGVNLHVDENPLVQSLRFRTCMPAGCLVSINFDAPTLVALRAGTTLNVTAIADGGTDALFSISLQGFAAALDRLGALSL